MSDPVLDTALNQLATNKGLAIGEVHGDLAPQEWLRGNLPTFRANGVSTLFMEMFRVTDQSVLDDFYAGKPGAEEQLTARLQIRWGGFGGSKGNAVAIMETVRTARDNGVRVIGIDLPTPEGEERLEYANPRWAATVENYMREHPGEKYLVYVGAGHTAREAFTDISTRRGQNGAVLRGTDEAIPAGVDRILGIPSIDFDLYRDPNSYDPARRAPSTNRIEIATTSSSNFVADLPISSNQRDTGSVAAPAYTLAPDFAARVDAIALTYRDEEPNRSIAQNTGDLVPNIRVEDGIQPRGGRAPGH